MKCNKCNADTNGENHCPVCGSLDVSASDVDALVINRFVYHYCAHYQREFGQITYIDGIAQMKKRITCMEDYKELKPHIAPDDHEKLVVASLSFIGMEQDL